MQRVPVSHGLNTRAVHGGRDAPRARARTLRVAIIAASALALAAVAAILLTAGTGGTGADELMYGGPLSFDMVHTHLNMKMRRSG